MKKIKRKNKGEASYKGEAFYEKLKKKKEKN